MSNAASCAFSDTAAFPPPPASVSHPSIIIYEPRKKSVGPPAEDGCDLYDFAFSCALVKVLQASHLSGVAQGGEDEHFACFVFDSYHFASVGVAKWAVMMDEGSLCVMLRHPLPLPAIAFGHLRSSQEWGEPLQAKQRSNPTLFSTSVNLALSLTLYDSSGGRVQGAVVRSDRTSTHRIATSDARLARRDQITLREGTRRPGESAARGFTLRASAFTRKDVQVCAYVDLLVRIS